MKNNYFYGLLISLAYTCIFLPNKCGTNPTCKITKYPFIYNSMIIIPINYYYAFHLHHWLIFLTVYIVSWFVKIHDVIIGFSLGLVIQGLLYKDCMDFVCKNPYF